VHPAGQEKKKDKEFILMKQDIILAGVGGQGILSIAFVIDNAALKQGLNFKQAEVHGMAQRGGAVQSHLRISDSPIYSDLIPKGEADMILSVELLETLRYVDYLNPEEGILVAASTPFINIPDYPDTEKILAKIRSVKNTVLVDSEALAKQAGSPKAQNMVMLGAASHRLHLEELFLLDYIKVLFQKYGEKIVEMNLKAYQLGRDAASAQL
jgi:indolepyruvate ferredoxin oxidoreductase beta subunit